MTRIEVFAPAKVNLALHVTGRRDDGYHLLDSLVAFAGVGDVLTILPEGEGTLAVTGPEAAGVPTDSANLILQVATSVLPPRPVSFHLDKRLPAAAGLGGGSADAAACFRGLAMMQDTPETLATPEAIASLLALGADIPMCVPSDPARVQGIGEAITPVRLPALPVVLANPRVAVPTGAVFAGLDRRDTPGLEPLPDMTDTEALIAWLGRQRNDLEGPARRVAPVIDRVLSALSAAPGCRLARMSGSGATCFALHDSDEVAEAAAADLRAAHPGWWVAACRLDGGDRAAPQRIRATT